MTIPSATLSGLVGSRLCHDLISPIGAIQNGLELLAMAGGADTTAEMTLIRDSCESAAARIRFFRIAFGSASDGQSVSEREAGATLNAYVASGRVQALWRLTGDQPRDRVQMAYLAFLCCETALPAGGTIQCDGVGGTISVSATAPRLRIDPATWSVLSGGGDPATMTPDRVQFALLSVLARDRGIRVLASTGEAGVRIELRF